MRKDDDKDELDAEQASLYRRAIGQLMWTLSERPDISFPVKELARASHAPTRRHAAQLKRLLRYIRGTVNMEYVLEVKTDAPDYIIVGTVDASWAAGPGRKSTSGGVLQVQGFTVMHWSRTQNVIAQSSCEAELISMNMGGNEATFVQTLLSEIGIQMKIRLMADSSSAIAVTQRRGLGRLRHLQVKELWLQERVRAGLIEMDRVPTEHNMADMLTKGLMSGRLCQLSAQMGLRRAEEEEPVALLASVIGAEPLMYVEMD
jgi:hypothetical protein